jgi:hypothetical protein
VTITEVFYHPPASWEAAAGGASLEWVEIYNEQPTVLNLSGYTLTGAVFFTFPHDTYLDGRSYLVVCADEDAVRARWGISNTIGNFTGRLDNSGETIVLNIFGGGPEASVKYSDRGDWPAAADGAGHSLVLKGVFLDALRDENWTWSQVLGGTPGGPNFGEATFSETVLIDSNETWRYVKGNVAFPAGWQASAFNDSSWPSGPTGIGYSDGDDLTELLDMQNGYLTYLVRKSFTLSAAQLSALDRVVFQVSYDDGIVAFVNGVEVGRVNMPAGDPTNATAALTAVGDAPVEADAEFEVPRALLIAGTNVIAASVHNAALTSSDASFVPRLLNRRITSPSPSGDPVPAVINECFSRTAGERWLEVFNTSGAPLDLSGFKLSDDAADLGRWTLPPSTVLPARGYLVVTEAESGLNFVGPELTFFLSRPDLSEVVDAQVFENPPDHDPPLDGFSDARYPDGASRFYVSTMPTRGAANQVELETDIVLNEVLYDPPRERADQEFIELHNRGSQAVDLSGFRFNKGITYVFPPNTVLAAGAYLVVAANPAAIEAAHGISGVHGPWEGTLSNGGELLRLLDRLDNVVDEVHYYDSGAWPKWADGGGSSLELLDPFQDNSVASAWEASDESGKSDWQQVTFTLTYSPVEQSEFHILMLGAAEVLLDAVSVQRSGTEYIANGGFESSTAGWIIEGNHIQSRRTTEDSFAGAACLKIVATGGGDTRANRIECDTSPAMPAGSYSIRVALRWLRGANLIYFSCFQQPPQFQYTHWMPYPQGLGTPGARNSVAVANLGPVISDVVHVPAVPAGGAATTVKARVSDADGVAQVLARYRVGTGAFQSATLFDDGLHDDGAAADGLYGGTVPGQTSGARVGFYIEARDSRGAVRTFPREAPSRTLAYVHSGPLTARSFTYRLVHDDVTWNSLTTRRLHSNELVDATFIFNESEVYYSVGTRFRGSPWNRPGTPRMYRVKFAKDQLYGGRGAINLSRYGNAQNERAAQYSVWRNSTPETTSPMSRSVWARMSFNDGTWMMEHVEPVNGDYLRLWFPEDADGLVMKITGKTVFNDDEVHRGDLIQWSNYSNRGTQKASYRWFFNLDTRELEDDYGPLVSLLTAMNGSNTVLDTQLEGIMDVEQFLRVYAARCAHDDWDTIAIGNGQNAYIYFASVEGRWKLFPWDMDHTWGNAGARVYPDADGSMARILQRPRFQRMYQAIVSEMVNGVAGRPGYWTPGELVTKYLDRNSSVVGADGVGGSGGVLNFMNARRASLTAVVPAQVPFDITTNGGNDLVVNSASTQIAGRAWVNVSTILLNSEPVAVTWTSSTAWQVTASLNTGPNVLDFLAFDREGNLLGSDRITVTSTFGWPAPTVSSVAPAQAMPGELVTVRGSEFHTGISVRFGGTASTRVVFNEAADPTTLQAEVPRIAPATVQLTVRNVDNRSSPAVNFTVLELPPVYVRGDSNIDGLIDLSDALKVLFHLFAGAALRCEDAADADNNELLEVTDAVRILSFLFQRGAPPPAPYPLPGRESDAEGPLGCEEALDPVP